MMLHGNILMILQFISQSFGSQKTKYINNNCVKIPKMPHYNCRIWWRLYCIKYVIQIELKMLLRQQFGTVNVSPTDLSTRLCLRSAQAALDISGLATIPETPSRPHLAAPPSLQVLKRPPLEGEYISVTDSSGSRVYLRQKEEAGTKVHIFCNTLFRPSIRTSDILCLL